LTSEEQSPLTHSVALQLLKCVQYTAQNMLHIKLIQLSRYLCRKTFYKLSDTHCEMCSIVFAKFSRNLHASFLRATHQAKWRVWSAKTDWIWFCVTSTSAGTASFFTEHMALDSQFC